MSLHLAHWKRCSTIPQIDNVKHHRHYIHHICHYSTALNINILRKLLISLHYIFSTLFFFIYGVLCILMCLISFRFFLPSWVLLHSKKFTLIMIYLCYFCFLFCRQQAQRTWYGFSHSLPCLKVIFENLTKKYNNYLHNNTNKIRFYK